MQIVELLNKGFQSILSLGAPPMMLIIFTVLGLVMRVKISKAIEGGLRLAIALTGMGAIINILTSSFGPALKDFVQSTGINLSVTDVGWPPLATITWGSIYTLYFAFVCIIVNAVMLGFKKTDTLNVDIFNLWHMSVLGLIIMYYNNNVIMATIFVAFIYVLMLLNADYLKPTMNDLLGYDEKNVTTSAHINLLIAPFAMILDKLIDKVLPFVDKYDFDAEKLNEKIGFWGSKFAIGAYLGVFVGLLGQQTPQEIFTLAFTGGVCLELFGFIGGWFGAAVEPISEGVTKMMEKKFAGRKLNIGIDWPFIGARAEVWAVANILAPILLIIALVLPGNLVLPLGGILLTGLTPILLLISRGRVIRMLIEGVILIPAFLWTGTLIAEFVTNKSIELGNFPEGLSQGTMFTAIEGGPIEKVISIFLGQANSLNTWMIALGAIVVYTGVFIWYLRQMKKRNVQDYGEKYLLKESKKTSMV